MAWVFLALLVALVAGSIILGWRRHLVRTSVVTAAGLGVVWGITSFGVSKDWHDLDGLMDCLPSCTVLQSSAVVVYRAGPVAVALLFLVAVWAWLLRAHRRRPTREP